MLIVEGPDGAGKTTLIQRLSEDLRLPVAERVVTKDAEPMADLVKWVEHNIACGLHPVIYDRHRLISEPIYGPALRDSVEPGFDNLRWLRNQQQRLRILNPFVIFCLPPIEMVEANVSHDDDNKVVRQNIRLIYWLYFNLAASWTTPSLVWDYTLDNNSYRGNTRYDALKGDVVQWMWAKGLKK
jgi:hypothetical protein